MLWQPGKTRAILFIRANFRSVQRTFGVTTLENYSRTQTYASSFSACKKVKLALNVA